MSTSFEQLNLERTKDYLKSPSDESFLLEMNQTLFEYENSLYTNAAPKLPFIFVFGLPRSGTTLLSQLVAYCLDVAFINNFIARFWLTPVCGIRLSKILLGNSYRGAFESEFAATNDLSDIHEFGYFWRYWLKKKDFQSVKNALRDEDEIDWRGLRRVLANIQREFGKAVVFKNIFGTYHIDRIRETLGPVFFLYIERDPLDVAVSILNARKKHYSDLNNWWSYVPPDYEKFIHLDYWDQIAGQVHYLTRFYKDGMQKLEDEKILARVDYRQLCSDPKGVILRIRESLASRYDFKPEITLQPPDSFTFNSYPDDLPEKERFAQLLDALANSDRA